jgi:hypothetical protein
MQLGTQLLAYALRQVIGESADQVAAFIAGRFADPSRALPRALARANDRAWQALALALAGDGLLDQIKGFLAGGDVKGFRDQVRPFLEAHRSRFEGTAADFRRACLAELKKARQGGALAAEPPDGAVARQATDFRRFADPQGLIDGARQAVAAVANDLEALYPNLARLLRQPTPAGGPPLLAAAFAYFFRREVEENAELARGLLFDSLQHLSAGQEAAFDQVGAALTALGERFDELLGEVLEQLAHIRRVTEETHAAVFDLQAELQRLGGLHLAGADEVRRLLQEVLAHLARAGMQPGEVRPHDSFSIRGEDERRLVKQLLARFRQLPAGEQRQVPALLNGLGQLQVGAGEFAAARQTFAEVAGAVADPAARAEASYNAYRAALEGRKWDDALAAVRQAAESAPGRFAPFPLRRYDPRRILGAGGFGTAFLCHDRHFDEEVVVKTLHAGDLGRSVSDVFREAQVLRRLSHAAIIGVRDAEYADPEARARPYIVMDYFAAGSLEDHLRTQGPLTPEDLLAVARPVALAMKAAHDRGVFHRDLKPANVLVRQTGVVWEVKVIDFGLALGRQAIETSLASRSGGATILGDSVAGTLKYAPPEQMGELRDARGKPVPVGPYSDVYAFGKLCCYALFRTTEPRSRQLNTLPGGLRDLLEGCIEQELEHRLAGFGPVLEALGAADPPRRPGREDRPQAEAPAAGPGQEETRQPLRAEEVPPPARRKPGSLFTLPIRIPAPAHQPGEPLSLLIRIPEPEHQPGEIMTVRWEPVPRRPAPTR